MELRRQNRIVYQTKIRLRAPGRDDSVIARVQNLSPRGVYITGAELPAAGTEVQCRLVLAGERRTLRGRVAWVRPASPSAAVKTPGAGIEFLNLGQADTDLLHKLVDPGDEERQPVDVWFEGMKAPIRCQAVVAGEGVRLATRLPFMRLGSPVRVAFTTTQPALRDGTLDSVMLEPNNADGVPHLQLNVSMARPEGASGLIDLPPMLTIGRELGPEGPITPPAARTAVGPAPAVVVPDPALERERTQRFAVPGSSWDWLRRLAWRRGLLPALRWVSQGTWRPAGAGFAAGALAVMVVASAVRSGAPGPAPVALAPRPPAISPRSAAPAAPAAPAVALAAPVVTGPPAAAPAAAPPIAPAAPAAEPPAAAAAEPPEVAAAPALARARDAGDGVVLVTDGDGLRLSVAITGSSKGAEQYRLADPPGLAITLPHGRTRIASGVTRPGGGPVRLQIRRRPAGSHLRFFFDPAAYRGRVTAEGDAVVLQLERR
jgi:hypothetical protein